MSAAQELLSSYQHIIESLQLMTGTAGVYDVVVDGATLYSKAQTGRHAHPGEILELFAVSFGDGVRGYGT